MLRSGQSGVVSQWVKRRRLADKAGQSWLPRTPSARALARLMTSALDGLARSETILVAVVEDRVPDLVAARQVIGEFQSMICSKSEAQLWQSTGQHHFAVAVCAGATTRIQFARRSIHPAVVPLR